MTREKDETYTESEAARRRDEVVRRMGDDYRKLTFMPSDDEDRLSQWMPEHAAVSFLRLNLVRDVLPQSVFFYKVGDQSLF